MKQHRGRRSVESQNFRGAMCILRPAVRHAQTGGARRGDSLGFTLIEMLVTLSIVSIMAVIVGASVILNDPIFQGLALSLMAGEIASLLISRFAVPVIYFMVHAHRAAPSPQP